MKETLSKILDVIGKIMAVALLIVFLLISINHVMTSHFLPEGLAQTLGFILFYGAEILIGVVVVEFTIRHSFILTIIALVLIAAVVILNFFPGAIETIKGWIPSKS